MDLSLDELLAKVKAVTDTWSPERWEEELKKQRESWVRGEMGLAGYDKAITTRIMKEIRNGETMNTKHSKAKEEFWKVVRVKCEQAGQPIERSGMLDPTKLVQGIDYMLDQLPTWAVDKATGWMEDWKPK